MFFFAFFKLKNINCCYIIILKRENGILAKANVAKNNSEDAQKIEENRLSQYNSIIDAGITASTRGTESLTQEESSLTLVNPSAWTVVYNKVIRTGNQCTVMFG